MIIKISKYAKFQEKLEKLIKEGNDLYKVAYKNEEILNEDSYYGYYPDDKELYIQPIHLVKREFLILVWKKQCHHFLSQIGIHKNPSYRDVYSILENSELTNCIHIQEILVNLQAILGDLYDGLFENLFLRLEIHSTLNYLVQAQELFDEGQYILSGVVAVVALECFLKERAREVINSDSSSKEDKEPKGLINIVNFLKSKSILEKTESEIMKRWADLRNNLVHGDHAKISSLEQIKEIKCMLTEIEIFIKSKI